LIETSISGELRAIRVLGKPEHYHYANPAFRRKL
jgi:hypothetical protein